MIVFMISYVKSNNQSDSMLIFKYVLPHASMFIEAFIAVIQSLEKDFLKVYKILKIFMPKNSPLAIQ